MKKSIGMVISHKENENRRALVPDDVAHIINKNYIFIEQGYGEVLGYSDDLYLEAGIGGVCSHDEVLLKDIVCDPKIGDGDYLRVLYMVKQSLDGYMPFKKEIYVTRLLMENSQLLLGRICTKVAVTAFGATTRLQAKPLSCMLFCSMASFLITVKLRCLDAVM